MSQEQLDAAPAMTVLRTSLVRSRKSHTCAWCKRVFGPGILYHRFVFIEDGVFNTQAVCCYGDDE